MKRSLELANEMLEDSKLLLGKKRLRSAIDRSYYAMFHAAKGSLGSQNIEPPKTHKGVINLFGRELIKTGKIEKKMLDYLHEAFEMRLKSDYELYAEFGEDGAKELMTKAEEFVKSVREFLRK